MKLGHHRTISAAEGTEATGSEKILLARNRNITVPTIDIDTRDPRSRAIAACGDAAITLRGR